MSDQLSEHVVEQNPNQITAYPVGYTSGWTIEPASPRRQWMDDTKGFAYRCLPLSMANQAGWVITSPVEFAVMWYGGNRADATKIRFADESNHANNQVLSHFGFGIITFSLPWMFRTPPGMGMLVRGPTNSPKPGIIALDGYVETDWNPSTFTMNWKLTDANRPVRFRAGEPVCHIIPFRVETLDQVQFRVASINEDPQQKADYLEWKHSRTEYNADPNREPEDWQKHYMRGHYLDGRPAEVVHRTRLNLKPVPNQGQPDSPDDILRDPGKPAEGRASE